MMIEVTSVDISSQIRMWSIPVVLGAIFAWSYHKEPRRFRNAVLFLMFVWTLLNVVLPASLQLALWLTVLFSPGIAVVYLLINGKKVLQREGLRLSNALPVLLALLILVVIALPWVVYFTDLPSWAFFFSLTLWGEGFWAAFTLAALLLYSWFYQKMPRKTRYDYIVVHGAGLMPDGTPTPLLAGRADKAFELWQAQGCVPQIVASGGQGADEACSEAEAISRYLQQEHGVPAGSILLEGRSTTTWENVSLTKELLDARSDGTPYRCCLVTSDYHVFRTVEYAHKCGMAADGMGSKTASYYFPTAFLREYIALSLKHWWPYAVIAAAGLAVSLYIAYFN